MKLMFLFIDSVALGLNMCYVWFNVSVTSPLVLDAISSPRMQTQQSLSSEFYSWIALRELVTPQTLTLRLVASDPRSPDTEIAVAFAQLAPTKAIPSTPSGHSPNALTQPGRVPSRPHTPWQPFLCHVRWTRSCLIKLESS